MFKFDLSFTRCRSPRLLYIEEEGVDIDARSVVRSRRSRTPSPILIASRFHSRWSRDEPSLIRPECEGADEHRPRSLSPSPVRGSMTTTLGIPVQLLAVVQGKEGKNFTQLEQVHGVRINLLATKNGDPLQEICITTEDPLYGPSKCSDAVIEIEKVSIYYLRMIARVDDCCISWLSYTRCWDRRRSEIVLIMLMKRP